MPVTQLVEYFNTRFGDSSLHGTTEAALQVGSSGVEAHFGPLRLSSGYAPVAGLRPGREPSVGDEALLIVHSANGTLLRAETPYTFADSPEKIVYLDRLVRCLHMLNYLLLDKTSTGLLLRVHPRHVVSVDREHGQLFETVLARCGLTPARIVLQLLDELTPSTDVSRLNGGLRNYRRRGYRICTRICEDTMGDAGLIAPGQAPLDIVRLDASVLREALTTPRRGERYGALLAGLHAVGAEVLQDGVAGAREVAFARWAGVDLVTGAWARGPSSSRPAIGMTISIDEPLWA